VRENLESDYVIVHGSYYQRWDINGWGRRRGVSYNNDTHF